MEWYHYVILIMFLVMVFSPVWFFGKVSKFLFDEAEPHEPVVQYVSPGNIIPNEETVKMIDADAKVLQNLDKMVKMSKKKHVKQMWKVKKSEFERKLRWNATAQNWEWRGHV